MADKTLKLCSWNVNGIRAVAKKGFHDWLEASDCDVLCFQETKAQPEQLGEDLTKFNKYPVTHFNSAERKGYSGVASFFSENLKPEEIVNGFNPEFSAKVAEKLNMDKALIEAFNAEGRVIHSKHKLSGDFSFSLFNIYFPNGGASDERYQFKLRFYDFFLEYLKEFGQLQPNIIVTGDYNTAHNEIDLARPKDNTKTSGFIREERDYLDRLVKMGFTDTFRYIHKDIPEKYTWWSYRTAARKRNVGWRIDYFFVSSSVLPKVHSADILSEVEGSDHCPVSLELSVD